MLHGVRDDSSDDAQQQRMRNEQNLK